MEKRTLGVNVENLQASIQFYQRHIPCTVLYQDANRALLRHGNTKFELVKAPSATYLAVEIALEHQVAAQSATSLRLWCETDRCRPMN